MIADLEEPHPKRQRTSSPANPTTNLSEWGTQPQAATQRQSQPPIQTERHLVIEDATEPPAQRRINSVMAETESLADTPVPADETSVPLADKNAEPSKTRTPPKRILKIRGDGKLASPKVSVGARLGSTKGQPNSAASEQLRESTAQEKILKVHPDGKLSSPKANAATGGAKRKGRAKNSHAGASARASCVVVMKYGANGDARRSIGHRVNEILGEIRNKPDQSSGKPSEPGKATHPFFSSKLGQKTGQRSEQPSPSEGQSFQALPRRNICGPRESRVTSKPPSAAKNTSAASGPIYPSFGTDNAKVTRFPGAQDSIWPPCDMLHVRQSFDKVPSRGGPSDGTNTLTRDRKLKNAQIQLLPEEDTLNQLVEVVCRCKTNDKIREMTSRDTRKIRRPRRKIMTGHALQKAMCSRVTSNLSSVLRGESQQQDTLRLTNHEALLHVYSGISQSHTAFDLFQYETQEWVHKYCPKTAGHVLQQGREAIILRDWLKGSAVTSLERSVGQSQTRDSSAVRKRVGINAARKSKRKALKLDGFVVSSDEEAGDMDEITDPEHSPLLSLHDRKTVIRVDALCRGERNANAIVISGPHGCGKTAAVFAVAKELGFEIFEVNSGSRRSGKDILDKVGDMTRNHLVRHRQEENAESSIAQPSEPEREDTKLQADLHGGLHGRMESFFQAKPVSSTKQLKETGKDNATSTASKGKKNSPKKNVLPEITSQPPNQKQSLILLEEVDVLFEEDKLFWATVIDLIVRSKRPVIMTCSDESLLPLEDLGLHAILRFAPPPETLATDYLLLVAASEGHLLSREAVQRLYVAKALDLRASLAELNFYCQMGVGDSKGGLEWMLIDRPAGANGAESHSLRVISEDTYCNGMGWLGGEDLSRGACHTLDEVVELCAEVWNGWSLDMGATDIFAPGKDSRVLAMTRDDAWHSLQRFDQSSEAFSAADTLPASLVRNEGADGLDVEQPALTDNVRGNYIEGRTLLQADPLVDYSGMSESVAISLRASATMIGKECNSCIASIQEAIDLIPQMSLDNRLPHQLSKLQFWSAFQPIAAYSPTSLGDPRGPSLSTFNSAVSHIATEVAPYIRAIVSYDLRLEEQRRQLSSLLSQPGAANNKLRTTRASRAALESGNKANTRRERWFPENSNFDAILGTGAKEWQDIALRTLLGQSESDEGGESEARESSLARSLG